MFENLLISHGRFSHEVKGVTDGGAGDFLLLHVVRHFLQIRHASVVTPRLQSTNVTKEMDEPAHRTEKKTKKKPSCQVCVVVIQNGTSYFGLIISDVIGVDFVVRIPLVMVSTHD